MNTQRMGTPGIPTADVYAAACIYAAAALTLATVGITAAAAWASALEHRRDIEERNGALRVRAEICTLERWLSQR